MADIIKKIKNTFVPPPTEEQLREKWLTKTLGLKKDPNIPHRYWIDDQDYITVLTGDEESFQRAVAALKEHFRAPQIQKASRETAAKSPFSPKKSGKKDGIIGALSGIATDSEPLLRNASKMSEANTSKDGLGFDPVQARDELYSTKGVPSSYKQIGYNDFMGDDPSKDLKDPRGPAQKPKKKKKGDDRNPWDI